jgi:hypothetical protein
VVVVDELRQPDGRRRPHSLRHLRGHRAVIGAEVLVAQLAGGAVAVAVVVVLYPTVASVADAVVVPNDADDRSTPREIR